jgi:hypothetical protein
MDRQVREAEDRFREEVGRLLRSIPKGLADLFFLVATGAFGEDYPCWCRH